MVATVTREELHDSACAKVRVQCDLFEKVLPDLMKAHANQWCVFLDGPQFFAETEIKALTWAYQQYDMYAGFAVVKVAPREVIQLPASVMYRWMR